MNDTHDISLPLNMTGTDVNNTIQSINVDLEDKGEHGYNADGEENKKSRMTACFKVDSELKKSD